MILISQPKSASTSMLNTLRKIGGLKGCRYSNPKSDIYYYEGLTLPHNNFQEITDVEHLKAAMASATKLYQLHLPPTKNNRKIVKNTKAKVLILLRDPAGSVEGYTRHIYSGRGHNYARTKKKAGEHLKVLTWFNNKWRSFAKNNPAALVINFEDIVLDNKKYIRQAIKFLDIPIVKNVTKLKRFRFTGEGMKKAKLNKRKNWRK